MSLKINAKVTNPEQNCKHKTLHSEDQLCPYVEWSALDERLCGSQRQVDYEKLQENEERFFHMLICSKVIQR
jgi:hypothetical protein